MNASKAKHRLLRWMRYLDSTESQPTSNRHGGYHRAHVMAYSAYTYAHRWSPKGIRTPWVRTSRPGGA